MEPTAEAIRARHARMVRNARWRRAGKNAWEKFKKSRENYGKNIGATRKTLGKTSEKRGKNLCEHWKNPLETHGKMMENPECQGMKTKQTWGFLR